MVEQKKPIQHRTDDEPDTHVPTAPAEKMSAWQIGWRVGSLAAVFAASAAALQYTFNKDAFHCEAPDRTRAADVSRSASGFGKDTHISLQWLLDMPVSAATPLETEPTAVRHTKTVSGFHRDVAESRAANFCETGKFHFPEARIHIDLNRG